MLICLVSEFGLSSGTSRFVPGSLVLTRAEGGWIDSKDR